MTVAVVFARPFSGPDPTHGRSGGIGRRAWFRSMSGKPGGGSSPLFGTIYSSQALGHQQSRVFPVPAQTVIDALQRSASAACMRASTIGPHPGRFPSRQSAFSCASRYDTLPNCPRGLYQRRHPARQLPTLGLRRALNHGALDSVGGMPRNKSPRDLRHGSAG